jgi:CheY-like chemotaxis protein
MKKVFKVLLAEDDPSSAKLVMHALDRFNFDVTHVPDGMAALSKVRTHRFDLIISDIMMPYLDGLSFIEKASEYIRETPTIMLTAVGERKNVLRAAQRQVSFYILKPIDLETLMEKILQVLGIQVQDLISKKEHPFSILVTEPNPNQFRLDLKGCPKKGATEEIFPRLVSEIKAYNSDTILSIYLDEYFFVEAAGFRILDELILRIIKGNLLRVNQIHIYSNEIKETKLDIDKFPNLMSCKLEFRG